MFQYENQQVDEYNMELKPGVVINGLHFKVENPKGVILYFHGNKGNLKKWGAIVSKYMNYNYDVFVIDYRGYGKREGKRSEKAMYDDGQMAYEYLAKRYSQSQIVIYGSLH